jgi:ketosteroid isomerase-like protein
MDEVNLEADEFIPASGGRVVVPGRVLARGQDSGIETEQAVTQVWTIRDGKAVRIDVYAEKQEALEAVGLVP